MSTGSKSISVVTIAVAAAVSAVVSAIVVSVGFVGLVLVEGDRGTSSPQTIVAALPSGVLAPAPAPAAATTSATTTDTASATVAPTTAETSVTTAPAAQPTTAAAVTPQATPEPTAPTQAQATPEPTTPTEAELIGALQSLLDRGVSEGTRAAAVEGGAAALPTIDAVGNALTLAGPVYKWTITGPVTSDGQVLTAQLKTSLVGFGDRFATLKWKWIDGRWKLSNESVCALAANALATCTV